MGDVTIHTTVSDGGTISSTLKSGDTINTTVTQGSQIQSTITGGAKGDKGDKGDTGATGATGPKGDTGAQGTNGVGVPTGGSSGQVLSKNSNTNYDTTWVDASTGGSSISGTSGSVDANLNYSTFADAVMVSPHTAGAEPYILTPNAMSLAANAATDGSGTWSPIVELAANNAIALSTTGSTGSDANEVYIDAAALTVKTGSYKGKLKSDNLTANRTLQMPDKDGTIAVTSDITGSSPLTTKGDVYTFSTADARLPVGSDGEVLSADSTATTGLKWIAAGGVGTVTSVGVSGSNGIGVSGSPVTASGTIALSLGNITPTSVVSTGLIEGNHIEATGANGDIQLTADTDGGEFNLFTDATGTLAIYGSTTNTLHLNLLDGDFKTGSTVRITNAGVAKNLDLTDATVTFPTLNQNTTGTASNVTGTVTVGHGGTGVATLTGIVKGNGTSAMTAATAGTDYTSPSSADTFSGVKTFNNGKLKLAGSTSGTTIVNAAATASGTLTLPAATDTLIGKATTDTLTNKTFDTAGTGNVLKINGTQVSAVTGTSSVVLSTSPLLTQPNIVGAASVPTTPSAGQGVLFGVGTGQVKLHWINSSGTDETVNTSANSSVPYKFSAYRSTAYTTVNGTFTKMPWNAVLFDTSSNYDATTNFRFTAPVSGFYWFNAYINMASSPTNSRLDLYKNGSVVAEGNQVFASASGFGVTKFLQLSAGDYIEAWYFANAAGAVAAGSSGNYFEGYLVSTV